MGVVVLKALLFPAVLQKLQIGHLHIAVALKVSLSVMGL